MKTICFEYGSREIAYLTGRDKKLAAAMERIGPIEREVMPELFPSVVRAIVGQQISTKAQETIYGRFLEAMDEVTPENVLAAGRDGLQRLGISHRKADYIADFAAGVKSGAIDLGGLASLPDDGVIRVLSGVRGLGVWTAEMLMIFSMQRPDVLSFGDLAIHRGLRMLYRHREIDRERFERYRARYSPCGSVASLYLWAIAGGALPELTDPARPAVRGAKRPQSDLSARQPKRAHDKIRT